MAKVIDITDKLDFDANPKIIINKNEYEVNSDAETVLKIMGMFGADGGVQPAKIVEMYELIFNEKERKKISELQLKFNDFQALVMTAVNLITGNDEEQGE